MNVLNLSLGKTINGTLSGGSSGMVSGVFFGGLLAIFIYLVDSAVSVEYIVMWGGGAGGFMGAIFGGVSGVICKKNALMDQISLGALFGLVSGGMVIIIGVSFFVALIVLTEWERVMP